ncbi:partial N-acetylmuramate 1-kinase, partial [biofilm metagenome]
LEDFGTTSYLDCLNSSNAGNLYGKALDSLFQLQSHADIINSALPRYDEALLARELSIFSDWYINQLIDIEIPAELWESTRNILIQSALEQPVTCVHRDFHSRNLMVLDSASPGIIDFQDAIIGPITYDVVSLLRDCYVDWPQALINIWLHSYFERLRQNGLINCDLPVFTRWFDLMGMQRHLKAIGIFSRLHLRDGKSGYLNDIPRTMNYVVTQAKRYPELAEFCGFLENHITPPYLPDGAAS